MNICGEVRHCPRYPNSYTLESWQTYTRACADGKRIWQVWWTDESAMMPKATCCTAFVQGLSIIGNTAVCLPRKRHDTALCLDRTLQPCCQIHEKLPLHHRIGQALHSSSSQHLK